MGFEVTPSKTATLDLTPIKQKEKVQVTKTATPPKQSKVHMEETKITTTK